MNSRPRIARYPLVIALMTVSATAQQPRAPFAQLDRRAIPKKEISVTSPKELVAILGSHRAKGNGRIALHPSELIIASAEFRIGVGAVRIWNAKTLERIIILHGHTRPVADVAFSPDGRMLATVAADRIVRIWSVSRRERTVRGHLRKPSGFSFRHLATLRDHKDAIHSVAFSPDGKMMATGEVTGRVILWKTRGGVPKRTAVLPPPLTDRRKKSAVAFSPDSRRLAVGFMLETVLWNVTSDRPRRLATLRPKTGTLSRDLDDFPSVVESVAFSPDGKWLAVGRYNSGGVRLWNMKGDFKRESAWLDAHTTRTVAFSADGKIVYSGGTKLGHVWDVGSRRLRGRFQGRWGLAPLRDGRTLLSTHSDSTLHRWDTSGSKVREIAQLRPHEEDVRRVKISNDGRTIVTTANRASVRVWDVGSRLAPRARLPFESSRDAAIALTPDGKQMVVANHRGVVLWDISSATPKRLRQIGKPVKDQIFSLVVSPNSRFLAMTVRFGAKLLIWDLSKKSSSDPITSINEYGGVIGFSPDGQMVASNHIHRKRVRIWDLNDPKSPRMRYQIDDANNAAMSSDGRWIATANNEGVISIWQLETDKPKRVRQFKFLNETVNSIAFDPNRRRLAVSYASCRLVVGDVRGKKVFDRQFDDSFNARFSPDGRHIVTRNRNGVAYVLRLKR